MEGRRYEDGGCADDLAEKEDMAIRANGVMMDDQRVIVVCVSASHSVFPKPQATHSTSVTARGAR
jgi:hypothetical protein